MKHHLQLPHTHTFGSQTFLNSKEVKEQRSCLVQCVLQGLGLLLQCRLQAMLVVNVAAAGCGSPKERVATRVSLIHFESLLKPVKAIARAQYQPL